MTLDLDAVDPPRLPSSVRYPVVSVRMPAHLKAWATDQALIEHTTVNAWIVRLIARSRTDQLPADVREWLVCQAAQCGLPGDPDAALVVVLRHLADRWPAGARLNP